MCANLFVGLCAFLGVCPAFFLLLDLVFSLCLCFHVSIALLSYVRSLFSCSYCAAWLHVSCVLRCLHVCFVIACMFALCCVAYLIVGLCCVACSLACIFSLCVDYCIVVFV